MKRLRFEEAGVPILGLLSGDEIVPLDALSGRHPTMLSIIAAETKVVDPVQ